MIDRRKKTIASFVIDNNVLKVYKAKCGKYGFTMSDITFRLVLYFVCNDFSDIFNPEKLSEHKKQFHL